MRSFEERPKILLDTISRSEKSLEVTGGKSVLIGCLNY